MAQHMTCGWSSRAPADRLNMFFQGPGCDRQLEDMWSVIGLLQTHCRSINAGAGQLMIYSGFRVDGPITKRWFIWTPSKRHVGVCAIYSETTVLSYFLTVFTSFFFFLNERIVISTHWWWDAHVWACPFSIWEKASKISTAWVLSEACVSSRFNEFIRICCTFSPSERTDGPFSLRLRHDNRAADWGSERPTNFDSIGFNWSLHLPAQELPAAVDKAANDKRQPLSGTFMGASSATLQMIPQWTCKEVEAEWRTQWVFAGLRGDLKS